MAFGLEARLPFLRRNLVEWSLGQNANSFLIEGKQKEILKKTCNKYLPKVIINRKKQPFTSPYISWIKGPLKSTICSLILNTNYHESLGLNINGLKELLHKAYLEDESLLSILWGIAMLYKWYDLYKK